jgi:hypothetical protein
LIAFALTLPAFALAFNPRENSSSYPDLYEDLVFLAWLAATFLGIVTLAMCRSIRRSIERSSGPERGTQIVEDAKSLAKWAVVSWVITLIGLTEGSM